MQGWVLACLTILSVYVMFFVSNILRTLHFFSVGTTRKLIHIFCGISLLLPLPYHEDTLMGRFWGTSCAFLYAITFYIFGSGRIKGLLTDFLITSVCRSKNASEMRKEPLIYCVSMALLIFIFWRSYPPSIIGLMVMITGDGLAEVVGQNIKSHVIINPWGRHKTVAGCISVVIGGMLGSILMCYYLFGRFYIFQSFIGGMIGVFVEFYSPPGWDDLLIPIPIAIVGYFFY